MAWLAGNRIAAQVMEQLGVASDQRWLVVFDNKLAARLARDGLAVVFVSDDERVCGRSTTTSMMLDKLLASEDHSFDGAVVVGTGSRPERANFVGKLIDWLAGAEVKRMILIDRGQRTTASKRALLAGLSRINQSVVSRVVITTGDICRSIPGSTSKPSQP